MKIQNVKSVYEQIKNKKENFYRLREAANRGDIDGFTPPSVIVCEYGYPKVSLGLMFTTDNTAAVYDAPRYWAKNGYDVKNVFDLRSRLINAKKKVNISDLDHRFIDKVVLSVMSKEQVGVNMNLSRITFSEQTSQINPLYGLSADLNELSLSDNVKVDRPVENVYGDKDLKATDGVNYLYKNKIDENKISKLLSVGAMGAKRKLVPTAWSITAVDDCIGKNILEEVKSCEVGSGYVLLRGGILGNMFTFLLIPGKWSFELIEAWNNGGSVMIGESDYEFYKGRKEYVKHTAGAYYAVRLAILEKLIALKRQYSVIAVREITPEYFIPLGVWVVRESARKALDSESILFPDFASLLRKCDENNLYVHDVEKRSRLIDTYRSSLTTRGFV